MDDLFGDGPQVQVPQLPIIKSLSSRLDELAGSNACKYAKYSLFRLLTLDADYD